VIEGVPGSEQARAITVWVEGSVPKRSSRFEEKRPDFGDSFAS
jgi:hypothetical protein